MRITSLIIIFLIFFSACNSRSESFQTQNLQNKGAVINAGDNANQVNIALKQSREKMTGENENYASNLNSVSLQAKAEKTENELLIKYEVENRSEQNFYLWDRMIGFDGSGKKIIDRDSAYVFYEEPDTVRIMRAVLPLPETREIGKKEIPFVREFPAKSKLQGTIKLRLPVEEFSPYFEPLKEENAEKIKCSEIRLIIGWTPFREGMQITERTLGNDKVFAIRGAWSPPYQETVERKIPIDVDLLIYKTEFERQMPLK